MRLLVAFLVVGSSLMAQRGGGVARAAARPSVPAAPATRPNPPSVPATHRPSPPPARTAPATVSHPTPQRPVYNNGYGYANNNRTNNRVVIAPYPVFVYGGYYAPYGYPYYGYAPADATGAPVPGAGYGGGPNSGSDSNYAYDSNSAPQSSPAVIINQNFPPNGVSPGIQNYSGPVLDTGSDRPSGANEAPPVVFLIAMKDHTIFPASAYWVEGDTLNYITTQGVHNRASLDLVDYDFSAQLNRERHIDFALPPSAK